MKTLDHPARRQQPVDYITGLERVRMALERHAELDPTQTPPPDPEPKMQLLA